jgi:2-methylcitrate dehydratase PrpD
MGCDRKLDPLGAALVNGLSASAHAFDDAHLQTVAHPGAPTLAALLAHAEQYAVSGPDFLHALILSYEVQCRLSCALAAPPAHCNLGWYMTGVTGAVGVAAGVGKLMGLSEQQLAWAMGLGAVQASGLRVSHGTMACAFIPGDAGRNGLLAARLAANGFTCHENALAAHHGLLPVLGDPANPEVLTDRLGQHWETMNVSLKPFPSGCLTHAVIDACLALVRQYHFPSHEIVRIDLQVHRLALELTGRQEPRHSFDAQASIQHWAGAVLHYRRASLAEASEDSVHDPAVISLRQRVQATVSDDLESDEARLCVTLRDGRRLEASAMPCIGSPRRPMSDAELQAKFLDLTAPVIGPARASQLSEYCWSMSSATDVARAAPGFWGQLR